MNDKRDSTPDIFLTGDSPPDPPGMAEGPGSFGHKGAQGPIESPWTKPGGNLEGRDARRQRTGNFLLSFGYASSGKTVFQSHLIRYLEKALDFSPRMTTGDANDAAHKRLNEWRDAWRRNALPARTPRDEKNVVELTFTVGYDGQRQAEMTFTILELSGEDLRTIVPGAAPASMMPSIQDYLSNANIKFVLVLVVDPESNDPAGGKLFDPASNDNMFSTLLDFLETNYPEIHTRLALLLLLSKPRTALTLMRTDRKLVRDHPDLAVMADLDDRMLHLFFEHYTPATYGRVSAWPGRTATVKLDIGEITGENELHEPDFADVSRIYSWIHEVFTGRPPGPGWLRRIWEWLQQ